MMMLLGYRQQAAKAQDGVGSGVPLQAPNTTAQRKTTHYVSNATPGQLHALLVATVYNTRQLHSIL